MFISGIFALLSGFFNLAVAGYYRSWINLICAIVCLLCAYIYLRG